MFHPVTTYEINTPRNTLWAKLQRGVGNPLSPEERSGCDGSGGGTGSVRGNVPPANQRGNMKYINCTPHAVVLNDGTTFPPCGSVARVTDTYTPFVDGVCKCSHGAVQGLPAPVEGNYIIVSAMVLAASDRKDLVAPATGHKDAIRNEKGQIVSVPGFVRY